MFTLHFFTLFMSTVLLPLLVSSHPVAVQFQPRSPTSNPAAAPRQVSNSQTPLSGSSNSTKLGLHTLQDLYEGNQKFRENARIQAEKVEDEAPSFMFLGCVDNSRLSPSSIFNAPAGSTVSHSNIANQYSNKDPSAYVQPFRSWLIPLIAICRNAAVAYAVETLNVQHIIVLGHYGCKGVEAAITQSSKTSGLVRNWLRPITDMYSISRRREIVILRDSRKPRRGQDEGIKTAPPATDAGFRALVEENVKRGVKELRTNSIITQAYASHIKTQNNENIDVFVHGFVYDEGTGEVHDLHVSFGPPGKAIPTVPFKAIAAAKNFHRDNDRPGISKGKTWDFSKVHP
ncbi:hypothetical protein CVT25_014129 [Psilocybe cyanescens]|uniref:Carbonic anhydrase n=1 Tax=Psilocybe cyanescens TaxID=93625 RepID=A0A409XG11_PSICY|nr:hypothetical protein CVT25_014129 [Psilocybe cyanescens]